MRERGEAAGRAFCVFVAVRGHRSAQTDVYKFEIVCMVLRVLISDRVRNLLNSSDRLPLQAATAWSWLLLATWTWQG